MTSLFKLTRSDFTTMNNTLWGSNITHTAPGGELCTRNVLHAYRSAGEAVFFDPIHGNFGEDGVLWACDGDVCVDDGTKVGCTRLRTLEIIKKPEITIEQRVTIAIRCALMVYQEATFTQWATSWLSGKDRSRESAWAAADAAEAAVAAAARTASAAAWAAVAAAARTAAAAASAAADAVAWAVEFHPEEVRRIIKEVIG